MSKMSVLKAKLAEALKEDEVNVSKGGSVCDAAALSFVDEVLPVAEPLLQCAEFLADALPGIEAYANSLSNETARSMWQNQIAKYKVSLALIVEAPESDA